MLLDLLSVLERLFFPVLLSFLTGMFATAFYLVADIKKGKMFYTNAGHPKPYLLKRNNGNVERLEHNKKLLEPALGLFDKYDYTVSECSMNNDDIVLLFTDGIYEVENAELDMFGEKQLQQIVKDKLSNTPEIMLDAIIQEINNFAGKTEFSDDVCMVSMHVRKSTL